MEKCFSLSYISYVYRYVTWLLNGVCNIHNDIHIAHNKTQNHFLRNTNDVAFDIIYKNIIFIALSNKIDQLSIFHWISSLQKQNLWSIRRLVPDKGIISQRPFLRQDHFVAILILTKSDLSTINDKMLSRNKSSWKYEKRISPLGLTLSRLGFSCMKDWINIL